MLLVEGRLIIPTLLWLSCELTESCSKLQTLTGCNGNMTMGCEACPGLTYCAGYEVNITVGSVRDECIS